MKIHGLATLLTAPSTYLRPADPENYPEQAPNNPEQPIAPTVPADPENAPEENIPT